jgi:quercetin dioxygenase-like cupin family protein
MVRFAPGARTAWHSHGLGQTLHVVSGVALIGTRDGVIIEAHPGDTIGCPPGEEHWHGAPPDQFMEHIALWEGDEVNWLEHVTDAEYGGPRTSTRTSH